MCQQRRIWSVWLWAQANPECQSKKNHILVNNINCLDWHADTILTCMHDFLASEKSAQLRANNYLTVIQ